MNTRKWIAAVLAVAALLGAVQTAALPTQDQLERSDIIFAGKVERLGEASFAGVPEPARAIVVKVERVLEKPAPVMLAPDSLVTVQVVEPGAWQKGERATFYTEGWIFGEGVAVREVAHEPGGALAAAGGPSETGLRSDAMLRKMVRSADAIAVGRVVSVRPARRTLGVAEAALRLPISEHDPEWREAVVEVDSWVSGARNDRQVVVRFPGSLDVAFYGLPKLREGQSGMFVLEAEEVADLPKALLAGEEVNAYVVQEVLSREDVARVRAMVPQ